MRTEAEIRKKTVIILSICIFALFFGAVWNAFLSSFVPRHRTLFWDYDSFRNKAEESGLAWQLPESAYDIKYYWGVDMFINVAGYGISLSDEAYKEVKLETIKRYQERYDKVGYSGETLYLYSESVEKDWVEEEWLEAYYIEDAKSLVQNDEEMNDYYILAYDYTDSGRITYFTCMLCNDSAKRMIEISCVDRNAQGRKR